MTFNISAIIILLRRNIRGVGSAFRKTMGKIIGVILLSITVFYQEVISQCPGPIGTNDETAFPVVGENRIYLNTDAPAPCSGTITEGRICYYLPDNGDSDRHHYATLAVYRRMSNAPFRYERVSGVLPIFIPGSVIVNTPGDFVCTTIDIIPDYNIQAGDVVGDCVFNPPGMPTRRLNIVGEASGYSLMQTRDDTGCSTDSIPSTISRSQLSVVTSRILHVYANITTPTTSPPTSPMPPTEQATSVLWTTMNPTEPSSTTTSAEITTDQETPTTLTPVDQPTTTADGPDGTTTALETTGAPETTETTNASNTTDTPEITDAPETTSTPATSISETTTSVSEPMMTTSDKPAAETTETTDVSATSISEFTTTSDGPANSDEPTTTSGGTTVNDVTVSESETDSSTSLFVSTAGEVVSQINGGLGLEVIVGVVIVAVVSVVVGATIVIMAVVFLMKRRNKSGHFSPTVVSGQSNGTVQTTGVDNMTYDVTFGNGVALQSSYNMYDDVAKSKTASTGESNYYDLAESTFTNTYETLNAGSGVYSEVTAPHERVPHVQSDQAHKSTGGSIYHGDSEYAYTSPEEFRTSLSYLLERNKEEDIYGNLDAYCAPASDENEIYSQLRRCGVMHISHVQIKTTGHLGSGQFGNVEKGTWQSKVELEVALKTLKTDSSHEDKVKFLQEAAIMAQFKHPNIVTLHGVVSDKEPLMLIVEFMHKGDLRDYLFSIRPDPEEEPVTDLPAMLLSFSQHVALGMQYLSSKGFVHRDLAARNILVSKNNICKVADFGMSRDLADETYYVSHGGVIPVKWTAPEAIHYKKYSTASDVWSYGCLLYEIWSIGSKPFEGISNIEVVRLVDSNKRLSPPPGCPRLIYKLVIKCWNPVAGSRPGFREITIVLTGDQSDVLSIPQDDLCTHKLASVLGAPIEAAKDMYIDLQDTYEN